MGEREYGRGRGPKIQIRVNEEDRAQIERACEARGVESLSELVRSVGVIVAERDALLRAALEPVRGTLRPAEAKAILDALNGIYLAIEVGDAEWLGSHVALEVADGDQLAKLGEKWGIDGQALARRLAELPRAQRAAIELWAADLWRRYQDDVLWDREIAWLTGPPARSPGLTGAPRSSSPARRMSPRRRSTPCSRSSSTQAAGAPASLAASRPPAGRA